MRERTIACLLLSLLPPALLLVVLLLASQPRVMAGGMSGSVARAIAVTVTLHVAAGPGRKQALRPVPQTMATATDPVPVAGVDDGEAYLPAARLTERPQLLQDIAPDWRAEDSLPQRMACTLLVSEYGDVDRVLCDDPVAAPAALQVVGERFRAARFAPGRLYGRAVRSALRIELRLD